MREYELRLDPYDQGQGQGPESELRSLLLWLKEDETLRHGARGRIGSQAPPPAGSEGGPAGDTDMGSPGFDLLQLALGSGLSAGSLVFAVLQWQASRRRAPALIVRRGPYEVRLTGDEAGDPQAVRRIVAALEGADGGGRAREGEGAHEGGRTGDEDGGQGGADDGTA
ncbi:hypothetical protein AMK16_28540 [Streptomyces sp. CB00455]|uniref:effector-associated constant component EACC1 n=1 Tax=Streptomyces sp. CB00455 TaxID=1703927 RepID=UPI00093D922C|nr:hypothetical protein [Streptomyces sp. CB00455]OKK15187.1 hypothetical protein AMK16_28540 [Streptomyces sp. CB00455]